MSHFWVDDMLHSHPKARKAGLRAMGLWTVCGSFMCGPHGSKDGTIDREDVERIARDHGENDWRAMAQKLLTCGKRDQVGLWEETENGYRFHDFHHYRPGTDKDQIRKERDAARKRRARMHDTASADASADIPRTQAGQHPDASADGERTDIGRIGTRPRMEISRARPRVGSSPSSSPSGSPLPPKGEESDDDAPAVGHADVVWLRALRLAGAAGIDSRKHERSRGEIQAFWISEQATGTTWEQFVDGLTKDAAEWVHELYTSGKWEFSKGWPWGHFAAWLAARDAVAAAGPGAGAPGSRWSDPTAEELGSAGGEA